MSLVEAIDALTEKERDEPVRHLLEGLRRRLYQGESLSVALGAFPSSFPALYVATVRASERSGAIAEALRRFVAYQQQIDLLKKRLVNASIYPAVLLMGMFQFGPGTSTPLQFYLSSQLHAPDAVYGYWTGIFYAAFVPMFVLYGWLCRRVSLRRLLWWGTAIMVPQLLPMALIHRPQNRSQNCRGYPAVTRFIRFSKAMLHKRQR